MMSRQFLIATLALCVGTLLAPPATAQAPSGHVTFVDKETGLQVYASKGYTEIPQQPTEVVIRGMWERKKLPRELGSMRRAGKPRVGLFLYRKGATGVTGPRDGDKPVDEDAPASLREWMEKEGQVRSFTEFMKKKLRGWEAKEVKGREGEYTLQLARSRGDVGKHDPAGYLVMRQERGFVYGIYGYTINSALPRLKSEMAKMSRGLELPDSKAASKVAERKERSVRSKYRGKKFRGIDQRVRVRLGLARGWDAEDTENFIIVYKSKNRRLIKRIARDIEAMQGLFSSAFPPEGDVDAVSIVRICLNAEEYHAYGAPRGSGGYWHSGEEELVLYDYDAERKRAERAGIELRRRIGNADSMRVLKHEAFHQYIFFAAGRLTPHDWFNEGHADYFSGAAIANSNAKILRIDPSPARIARAKSHFETGKGRVGLERMLRAERPEFYNPRRIGDYYAAAWGFVYFMRKSEVVANHPQWSTLIDRYYARLNEFYDDEVAKLGEKATVMQKRSGVARARQRAIAKVLDGLEIAPLEKEWEKFVTELEYDPEKR